MALNQLIPCIRMINCYKILLALGPRKSGVCSNGSVCKCNFYLVFLMLLPPYHSMYTGGPRISWFHNSWSSQIHDFFQASISWIPRKFMILKQKIAKKNFSEIFFGNFSDFFFRFVYYFFVVKVKLMNYRRRLKISASKDSNLW